MFAADHLTKLKHDAELYPGGWYDPPPGGVAVLFGTNLNPSRVSFDSLRQPEWWPSGTGADWNDFLMYFYTSPCPKRGGTVGDFAITLYRGTKAKIRSHYAKCLDATEAVLEKAAACGSSRELFICSNAIFDRYGLQNVVVSKSDITPLDLGHTLPRVEPTTIETAVLSVEERERIRRSRRFVNGEVDWLFDDGLEFSIEPQLRDPSSPELPQVAFHFRMFSVSGNVSVDPDVHELLARWEIGYGA